jgi:uncharacterized membrane protein
MRNQEVLFALLATLSWGVWAVLADVATRTIQPTSAMVLSYGTSVLVALGYLAVQGESPALGEVGVWVALAAGMFAEVGAVAFYAGLEVGRTGIVTTISALYFVVAALLGVLVLGDSIGLREVVGIGFAVAAVALLAT